MNFTEITSGLRFPEGPIAMPDGSVIVVEMFGPRITRVHPDGTKISALTARAASKEQVLPVMGSLDRKSVV